MTFERLSDVARAIAAAVPPETVVTSVNIQYVTPEALGELRAVGRRHEVQCWVGQRAEVTEVLDVHIGSVRFTLFAVRRPSDVEVARHEQGLCGCAARKERNDAA